MCFLEDEKTNYTEKRIVLNVVQKGKYKIYGQKDVQRGGKIKMQRSGVKAGLPNTYEKEFDNPLRYILYFMKIDTIEMVGQLRVILDNYY